MASTQSMKDLRGQWILVSKDEIFAHDPDLSVILRAAEEYEGDDVTVRKVLAGEACFY